MNNKQKESYLKNPNTCPYCESNDLNCEQIRVNDIRAEQEVICFACDNTWVDIYTITDVVVNPANTEAKNE